MITPYQKRFGVGPLGFVIGLLLFVLARLLDHVLGHAHIFASPKPGIILGLALLVLWICWHAWAMKTIRAWWNHDLLCTKGPFGFVRHPMYAGSIWIAGYGVALLFNSWVLLLWPPVWALIASVLVRKEETMMTQVFGDEYKRYAARTGRLFPRIF